MTNSDLHWFNEARYGMFIHWGPYSVAGRGEWVVNRERIPKAEYTEKYAGNFTAERFNPESWVELAKAAGMGYMVLTTRHHDGFCLWDSKTTEFNAVKTGPKQDLVKRFADAVRAGGLKLGFYFSVADWYHPDYPGPYCRDWPSEWKDEASRQRFVQYYRAQLEELMTQYGPVDMLWYDGCIPGPTDGAEVNAMVKQLQPQILINERNGEPFDFRCCEQAIRPPQEEVAWEACMTLNDNWGYHAGDHNYKTPRQVIRMLLETAGGGGNLLLNVGPKGDGTIPDESEHILREAGRWLALNREFLPYSSRSPFTWNTYGRLTTKGKHVYVHILHSTGEELCLAEIGNTVQSIHVLATGDALPFEQQGERLFIRNLPTVWPNPLALTLDIEVDGQPQPVQPSTTFWIPG